MIDNIYCNTMPNSLAGIFYKDVSDHFPIFIVNRTKLKKLKTSNALPTRNLCAENISKLKDRLSNSDWSHVINCNDVEVAYNNFVNIYEKLYNESCPIQSRTKGCEKKTG